MKIAFGMIVFNGDYVLQQCLEQIYPFASQILIAEGPVGFWQKKGYRASTDNTDHILRTFPDPEKKIIVSRGQYKEKDDECNAYMVHLDDDTDYLWQIDSDEIYTNDNLYKIIEFLKAERPTSVGVKPYSFYGGFRRFVGGFEQQVDNFLRIFKTTPDCFWASHRPPTMGHRDDFPKRHISSEELFEKTGAYMHHYSYCFPSQVKSKMEYYESKVAINKIIPNYYDKVFLPWILGDEEEKYIVEHLYAGVHEFQYQFRGHAFTEKFEAHHPEAIVRSLPALKKKIKDELINDMGIEL